MAQSITGRERILVDRDGEELEVFNHVSVARYHYVNSVNGHETFEPQITAGDSDMPVEYVTDRIAEYLEIEWMIDVEDHGIEVVDLDDPDVQVI